MLRMRTNFQPLITKDGKCIECLDEHVVYVEDNEMDACLLCTQRSEIQYQEYQHWLSKQEEANDEN
tara:strand:- start:1355 stop:1552 length:198 start_codon:yes stop_codon:yes gene_type:complete